MDIFLFSLMNRKYNKFSLTNTEDNENFVFCSKIANGELPLNPNADLLNRHINIQIISENKIAHQYLYKQGTTGYCFDYEEEAMAFYEYTAYTESINWSNGTEYMECCQKGYLAFENGYYKRAIDLYRQDIKYNPVAITAKIKIVSAYIRLQLFKNAIYELNSIYKYLLRNKDIASYYRIYGYIAIDLHSGVQINRRILPRDCRQ